MYPPQNPPPLKDSDLPAYRQPPPSIREFIRGIAPLLIYCVCGAVTGLGLGVFCAPMEYVYRWEHWRSLENVPIRGWGGPREPRLEEIAPPWMIGGFFGGVPCGGFLWLVAHYWSAAKHPVRAATLCASVSGSLLLIYFATEHVSQELPNPVGIMWPVVSLAAVMFAFAVFGFIHALIVRRAILWFEWWQSRSDQPSRSIAAKE